MVIAAFPAAKLGALLIKQISKPIANFVKYHAKNSPVFRKYICLPPAQFYNWCEKRSKMWLLKMGQPVNIKILNEADSIELGANLVGEAVIFVIAAGILISEYSRSARKEAAKEAQRIAEMQTLQETLKELFIQTEEQGAHIRELTRKLGDLETQRFSKVSSPKPKPPPEPPSPKEPPLLRKPPECYSSPDPEDIVPDEGKPENTDLLANYKCKPLKGVIFQALGEVESNFLIDPNQTREPGVIEVALNHLYSNVYRVPLTF